MANEQGPKNESEELGLNGGGVTTNENPEAFDVLKQNPVNPELFGDWKAIIKYLKENHVKVDEVELFGCVCNVVHIELPPVGNFNGFKTDVLMVKSGIDSWVQDGKLDKFNGGENFSEFLEGISVYMKYYGIDLGENIKINDADDANNRQHNDILKYIVRFLPRRMCNFLLDGGKVLTIADGEGNYYIKNLDGIEINRNNPISLLSPDSQIMENINYPIPGSYYESVKLLDWKGLHADEIIGKMEELKSADLVIVFRNNDKYNAMMSKLEQLVKYKYGGKVYCITIPKGTEKNQLTEQDKKALTEILTNCKCITDYTVSEWTGIETEKIEDVSQDSEKAEQQNEFLDIARSIESYYKDQGIDTVYILSSYMGGEQGNYKLLLEHGGFCQKEDGTIYYIKTHHDQDEEHYNDAKRFWKNLFKKMNVKFIESNQLLRKTGLGKEYIFDYDKAEGALAIVDYHFTGACECFENEGGKVVTFGGDSFGKGIGGGGLGEALAEKICERKL